MQGLVEGAARRVQPIGEHVERYTVQRERDKHLALVLGKATVDRVGDREHELIRFGLTLRTLAGIGHQRPGLGLEHHLALLPGSSA